MSENDIFEPNQPDGEQASSVSAAATGGASAESLDMKALLERELDERLKLIDTSPEERIERMNRADYIGMAVLAAACIVVLIVGSM